MLIAAQKDNLGMVQREQDDALKAYREWFERDPWTRALLKKMGDEPPKEMKGAEMQAALLRRLASQTSNDVHRLLAFALDGGLDQLALRVRQGVEYAHRTRLANLDAGQFRQNEWRPTEVPDQKDQADALFAQVFVDGLKLEALSVVQVLEFDDDTLRMLVAVFATDLDRWLRARDRALVERMLKLKDDGEKLSDAEADALGYESTRQATNYYDQIQTQGLESPHARLVELYIAGYSFKEIGAALGVSDAVANDHRGRIVRFLCRRLMES